MTKRYGFLLQVEKEVPSEEDLEKPITLEMKGTLDEQTRMLHVRRFCKTKNKLQFYVLQIEPFLKDFIYAEIIKENAISQELQMKTIINNIMPDIRMKHCTPACTW